jgi:hypothetical protein
MYLTAQRERLLQQTPELPPLYFTCMYLCTMYNNNTFYSLQILSSDLTQLKLKNSPEIENKIPQVLLGLLSVEK